MVFCKACARDVPGIRDGDGLLSCGRCGKFLKFDNYSTEATFFKNASGQVDGYLHNEEEAQYKKIIWEEMNREYLEEQAAKEAVAAAAKEAWEVNFKNCLEDMQAAKELEAAVAAAIAKAKKEKQQKRAAEAKNSVPAQSASEAALQMLTKKREFKNQLRCIGETL